MNNKKILGIFAALAIAVVTAFNVNINSQEKGLSDVSLANVEALAQEDGGTTVWCCNSFFTCKGDICGTVTYSDTGRVELLFYK